MAVKVSEENAPIADLAMEELHKKYRIFRKSISRKEE